MKTKLVSLAAMLLAGVYASTASATPEITSGKIGQPLIAFTFTYDVGGFTSKDKDIKMSKGGYYKLIADTDTFYKELYSSVLTTTKYGNAQFFADLINSEYLDPETKASDWTLIYVEVSQSRAQGFFAVNKKRSSIVFVGGYDESCFPINLVRKDGSGFTETSTTTRIGSEMEPSVSTEIGAYQGVETYCLKFKPSNSTTFRAYALLNSKGTYNSDYVNDIYSYTKAPTTVSGIVGDDGDGTIIGGYLSIGGLNPLKDASAYVTAYDDAHGG